MAPQRISVNQAKLLKQHRYILQKLATSNEKNRRKILNNAPTELFRVLNLVFKLLDNGRLNLNDRQINKIKKHKRLIRSASKLHGKDIKGKLTKQRGGALGTILSTFLPLIGGLLKGIL